jgi:hypothetical protein
MLTIGQLFDLGRACPHELDGLEFETKIRDVMHKNFNDSNAKI